MSGHAAALDDAVSERLRAIASRARLRADPASLFRRVGKEPDDWQADLLRRWDEPEEVFVCGSRQIGKSWGVAALIALESLLCPGTLTMITGPGERQAKELYAKVTGFIVDGCGLGAELDGPPGATSTTWRNGSLIRWAPGNSGTIRGFSPKLWEKSPRVRLVVEEASITEDAVANAIRPMMLAANGRFVALGTAFGQRGFFWDTFEKKPAAVRRYTLPVTDFPRLMAKTLPDGRLWVDAERERIGDFWFDQEYLCNTPEAPVWMGDYSFRPIGDVRAGDTVIGWTLPAGKKRQHLARSRVLQTHRREAEIVRVRLRSGSVVRCTRDHKWLTVSSIGNVDWYTTAKVGRRLVRVIQPTPDLHPSLAWDAAWLGGIYDGEGCGDSIAQSPTHNPDVYARIGAVLEGLGLRAIPQPMGYYISSLVGGRTKKQAIVDFINWTRPTRQRKQLDDIILGASFRHADEIVSIELEGWGEVVSMETTTGNYVVWGYASKNCKFHAPMGSLYSPEHIQAAIDDETPPLWPMSEWVSQTSIESMAVDAPPLF